MALSEVAQSIEVDTSNIGEDHFKQTFAAVQQRPASSRPCSPRTNSCELAAGSMGATALSIGTLAWQRVGITCASNARAIGTVSLERPRARLASVRCHSRDSDRGKAGCSISIERGKAGCSISIERGQTRKVDRHGYAW